MMNFKSGEEVFLLLKNTVGIKHSPEIIKTTVIAIIEQDSIDEDGNCYGAYKLKGVSGLFDESLLYKTYQEAAQAASSYFNMLYGLQKDRIEAEEVKLVDILDTIEAIENDSILKEIL